MCSEEERNVKSSFGKKYVLENYVSCILSPKVGPGWLSVRCQASGNGFQVVWIRESVLQGAIRGLSGGLMCVQMYIQALDTGLESPKSLSSQAS